MSLVERLHGSYVVGRRARLLSQHLANAIPPASTVLDVECGDGLVDRLIHDQRPELEVFGIDVVVRRKTFIPVVEFDGNSIPYGDSSLDCVMFVDVLHHTPDPMVLLHDAVRVARNSIIIKDHVRNGFLGPLTLRLNGSGRQPPAWRYAAL